MRKVILAATVMVLGSGTPAWAQSDGVSLRTDQDIQIALTKLTDGSATSPLPMGNTTVIAVRRAKSGLPESHAALDDVLVGQKGTPVTILLGGTLTGSKEISPGEARGGEITGARRVTFGPGDIIKIPAGLPHQMVVTKGEFRYLAFKMPKK